MKRCIFKKDKERPIAENPQFDADQAMDNEAEKKNGFFAKFGAYCRMHKKKMAAVCILCVFGLTAAGIGGYNAVVGDATPAPGDETVTIVDKDTGEEKVVKADSEAAKEAEENGDVIKATTKAQENARREADQRSEKKATNSKKPTSGSSNKGSSSGGSSSGGNSSSTKPAHQHSWQPVYGTRSVPYTATEYYQVMICTNCGAENPSSEHLEQHTLNYESAGRKEVTKSRQVTKYKTESYVSGYRCSCGATK